MRETLSIMKKDFNSIRFERSYLSILILQLVLFATARSFSAGMILLSSPESAQEVFELEKLVRVGVMNFNLSLENLSYFNDKREGMRALEEGEINALLVFLGEENGVKEFELYARRDDPKRELAVSLVRSELKELKEEIQLERMEEKDILLQFLENSVEMNTRELEVIYTFVLPLLLLFSVLISGSLTIDLITEELERKTYSSLLSSPIKPHHFLNAKIWLPSILTAFQSSIWIFLFLFQEIYIQNVHFLLPFLFSLSLLYSSVGALFSSFFKRNRSAQLAYTMFMLLSLTYFLGLPIQYTPSYIITRLSLDPFYSLSDALLWFAFSPLFYLSSLLLSSYLLREAK